MKHLVLFVFTALTFFLAPLAALSQQSDSGSLVIIEDARIDSLLQLHYKVNSQYPVMPGYRVQILFESGNNSKTLAREAIAKFNEEYPYTKAYLIFESPYYKVRVGDFRTKMEAEKFMTTIQPDYPSAFVTRDNISFPGSGNAEEPVDNVQQP
ncbi:MAG: SPOR domain-containing protein [Bacteroidales bacterium]|nr:SPOR domain-containing protein [Bacteroidales bacterium]